MTDSIQQEVIQKLNMAAKELLAAHSLATKNTPPGYWNDFNWKVNATSASIEYWHLSESDKQAGSEMAPPARPSPASAEQPSNGIGPETSVGPLEVLNTLANADPANYRRPDTYGEDIRPFLPDKKLTFTFPDTEPDNVAEVGVADTLAERGSRYGGFTENAEISQSLKRCMTTDHYAQGRAGWYRLSDVHKEALTMIAQKIARILNGDPNYKDNWHDIQGYARLAEERCTDVGPLWPKQLAKSVFASDNHYKTLAMSILTGMDHRDGSYIGPILSSEHAKDVCRWAGYEVFQ